MFQKPWVEKLTNYAHKTLVLGLVVATGFGAVESVRAYLHIREQKRLYEEANPNWQNDPKYKDHPKLQMLKLKKVDPDALAAANKEIAEERKKLETPAVATKSS